MQLLRLFRSIIKMNMGAKIKMFLYVVNHAIYSLIHLEDGHKVLVKKT